MLSNKTKAIAMLMAFWVCASTNAADTEQQSDKSVTNLVYFSLSDEQGFPGTEQLKNFDCTDKIYTIVELSQYPLGSHHLSIRWTDPAGTAREHTQYSFHVRGDDTRLWAWLSLSRATGAAMLQWLNPAAGLEEFIGPWSVEVRVDDKRIAKQNFEVSC